MGEDVKNANRGPCSGALRHWVRAVMAGLLATFTVGEVLADQGETAGVAAEDHDGEGTPQAPPEEQAERVERTLPEATIAADGLYVEFGRGVRMVSDDEDFGLTLRGRVQTRATWRDREGEDADILFKVRRARMVLLGDLPEQSLSLYIQLGLGSSDIERDNPIPLRDAVVTWTGLRDASVRAGQMKVPFSRERMISSSALQLADRSAVNAELSLDRDVGLQVYSSDLFGLGQRLGYQLGVFGGEGRNRAAAGTGLLYAGRLQVQPLGAFPDAMLEADLSRSPVPRLSLGVAGGYNVETRRARSTHGAFLEDGWAFDTLHAAADLMFKWRGLSVQAETIWRDARNPRRPHDLEEDEDEPGPPLPRTGLGWFVQLGWVGPTGMELSGRVSEVRPLADDESALVTSREFTLGAGRYMRNHDLKLQADYTLALTGDGDVAGHEARLQMQFFF
ncbi:MAG: hypothetical protein EA398_01870 [Deltaproteobacteria bacterium]|nr:MAG: hypothetical protein EA398_01870 [Deltaproteobacteria bacterium]